MKIIDSHFHWWPRAVFEQLVGRAGFPTAQRNSKGGYDYWREPGEPPPPPKDPNFMPARLRLTGGPVIRYALERFGASALDVQDEEHAVLTLSGPADAWTVSFALSFGGAAELLGPALLRQQAHERLKQTLQVYEAR